MLSYGDSCKNNKKFEFYSVEQRSNIKSLDKLKTFSLAKHVDPQQAVLNPEFNI